MTQQESPKTGYVIQTQHGTIPVHFTPKGKVRLGMRQLLTVFHGQVGDARELDRYLRDYLPVADSVSEDALIGKKDVRRLLDPLDHEVFAYLRSFWSGKLFRRLEFLASFDQSDLPSSEVSAHAKRGRKIRLIDGFPARGRTWLNLDRVTQSEIELHSLRDSCTLFKGQPHAHPHDWLAWMGQRVPAEPQDRYWVSLELAMLYLSTDHVRYFQQLPASPFLPARPEPIKLL